MKKKVLIFLWVIIIQSAGAQVASPQKSPNPKPFVLGEIIEIESKILNEKRILNIYLPEGYHTTDTTMYPVIYLLDGGADEDFIHVAGLVQFNNFPWINLVPKSIVVGIASTDRQRDFSYPTTIEADQKAYPQTGGSANFIQFIERELQPFIGKNYRCDYDKTIIGQSLGGLLATEILLHHPTLFNKYIIISPSLWWDDGSLLLRTPAILPELRQSKIAVYIGVGQEGITPGAIPHIMETDAKLLAKKIRKIRNQNIELYFDYLPQENHATISHQAVFNAFRLLYQNQNNHH